MELPIYQVDAFSSCLFSGNPAAVVLCEKELPSALMQSIAAENNLAETAFVLEAHGVGSIRWLTPTMEVNLCGHATLAAAHVLFEKDPGGPNRINFSSRSGSLGVTRSESLLWLDFPADLPVEDRSLIRMVSSALDVSLKTIYRGKSDWMAVVEDEAAVAQLDPDLKEIAGLRCRGLIVTAPGKEVDFVSRFFAPQSGVNEDAVTGSAHTTLTPYWSNVLGKKELTARQLSKRGGELWCKMREDRVDIGGHAITYLEGKIRV